MAQSAAHKHGPTRRTTYQDMLDTPAHRVTFTKEGAQDLWERDKYHFQKWAVEQVDGFVTTKRTAVSTAGSTSTCQASGISRAW